MIKFKNSIAKALVVLLTMSTFQVLLLSNFATPARAVSTVTLTDADTLKFVKSASTVKAIGSTSTDLVAMGKTAGDVVLYKSVGTFGGITIDCVVTTVAIDSGSISVYDSPGSAQTTGTFYDNWMINTVGGQARFKFQFFESGTYSGPNTGLPVVLQNVRITSFDLDSSSAAGSYQYSDFTGFQKYQMMSPTNLAVQQLTSPSPRVRFIANKTGSRSSVPEDQVLIKYDAVQTLEISFGNLVAGSTNYFGLVFGAWPNGGYPVEYSNIFNTPPTSTNVTLTVAETATATIPLSAFGSYADVDNNPFFKVRINTLPTNGKLQWNNGSTWADVTANQELTVADIDAGKLRYLPNPGANDAVRGNSYTFTFNVNDSLDYSTSANTMTLQVLASSQTITFNNPGSKASGQTFASGATATSNLTVVLESLTTGVCTVSGLDITTVATGTCIIVAKQPGDATYSAAAPVTQQFLVSSGTSSTSQTITFNNPGSKTIGDVFASAATASSNLTVTLTSLTPTICSVSGLNITAITLGNCTIKAEQAGNATYLPATPVSQTFAITSAAGGTTGPLVWTMGASATSSPSVKFYGMIDRNAANATWQVCYKQTSTPIAINAKVDAVSSPTCITAGTQVTADGYVSVSTSDLTSGGMDLGSSTPIYYQIIAWHNSNNKVYGKVLKYLPNTKPFMVTTAYSNLSTSGATINGTGNTNSTKTSTSLYFCYSTSPDVTVQEGKLATCNNAIANPSSTGKVNQVVSSSSSLTGLDSNKTYFYQIYGKRNSTTNYANILWFTTNANNPVVNTGNPTSLTSTTAVLNGSILSGGPATSAKFCISTSSTLSAGALSCNFPSNASVSASPSSVSGSSTSSITYNATGLTAGTTYYYQAIANRGGTDYFGGVKSFVVGAPSVSTLAAQNVSVTSGVSTWEAKINGYINPLGASAVEYSFCLSTTNSVDSVGKMTTGCITGPDSATALANTSPISFNFVATGLTAGTTYYFQAIGKNPNSGTALYSYGSVLSFITVNAPTATTVAASSITSSGATLNGNVSSNGASTSVKFCYSASNLNVEIPGTLDTCIAVPAATQSPLASNASSTAVSIAITSLNYATTYYFQVMAENSQGSVNGSILSFNTLAGPPTAITLPASSIASSTATINGTLDPSGATTTSKFCWKVLSSAPTPDGNGMIPSCTLVTSGVNPSTISATGTTTAISVGLTSLTTGDVVYYQAVGTNNSGTDYGDILSFQVGSPSVVSQTPSTVETTTASISANFTANGSNSTAYFCLTTSGAENIDGTLVDCVTSNASSAPSGVWVWKSSSGAITAGPTTQSYNLTGLTSCTTYYFQPFGNNTRGWSFGAIKSFQTKCTVVFDANSGSGTMANQVSNTAQALSTSTLTAPASKYFSKWNTKNDGTGDNYGNGANYSFKQDITLYAIWSGVASYSVSYDGNGAESGDVPTDDVTYEDGSSAGLKQASLTKTGHTFVGWNTAANGSGTAFAADGNAVATINSSNLSLYAKWNKNRYAVNYIANDKDSGSVPTESDQDYDSTYSVQSNPGNITKSGYTFLGWSLTDGGSVISTVQIPLGTTNLYAVWQVAPSNNGGGNNGGGGSSPAPATPTVTYIKVTYNGNGKVEGKEPATVSTSTGSNVEVSKNTGELKKTGYTLKEWNTQSDGKGTAYKIDGSDKITSVNNEVTLYAIWEPNKIKVTYNNNDNSNKTTTDTYVYDSNPLKMPEATNSKKGYDFAGWQESPSGGNVVGTSGTNFTPQQEVTLYAKWVEKPAAMQTPAEAPTSEIAPPKSEAPSAKPAAIIYQPAAVVDPNVVSVLTRAPETIVVSKVVAQTTPVSYGYQLTSDLNWSIAITSTTQFQQGAASSSGHVTIAPGNTVTTFGTGFKPFTQVDVYVHSIPTPLGSVITDANGNYTVTLPMPASLPAGDHTFQAIGKTFDDVTRTANVPITLLPVEAPKIYSKAVEVFFAMDSYFLDRAALNTLKSAAQFIKSKTTSKSIITVDITGWVQPTKVSPRVQWLSTNRAKVVMNQLKKLGLKAKFTINTPGHDKLNIAQSRRATAVITWSTPK